MHTESALLLYHLDWLAGLQKANAGILRLGRRASVTSLFGHAGLNPQRQHSMLAPGNLRGLRRTRGSGVVEHLGPSRFNAALTTISRYSSTCPMIHA